MQNFKSECKRRGNKNFTFVKIRVSRLCSYCLKTICAGTECLTINPRRGTRRWYCSSCVEAMLNVGRAKCFYNSINFGDEGAAQAGLEWISEAESELEALRGVDI